VFVSLAVDVWLTQRPLTGQQPSWKPAHLRPLVVVNYGVVYVDDNDDDADVDVLKI